MSASEIEDFIGLLLLTVILFYVCKAIKVWGPFDWEKRLVPIHFKIRLYGTYLLFILCLIGTFIELCRIIIGLF